MKKRLTSVIAICTMFLLQVACDSPQPKEDNKVEATPAPAATAAYTYSVSVSSYTNTNAPALQSFAHGVDGDEVLLFAGRTNETADDGGLHDINGDYAQGSFPQKSYNTNIYVYNMATNTVNSITYDVLLDHLVNNYCPAIDTDANIVKDCKQYLTDNLSTIFKATNPIVTQYGNTLYTLGGYGEIPGDPSTYLTYNQITSINIPNMIKLIKSGPLALSASEWQGLIQLGKDETNTLVSTGAEMFKIGPTIYLAGGHNFGNNQKYLDAVYPFTITSSAEPYKLNVTASNAISDVADPKAAGSDTISKFRRRDGPVTPAIFKNDTGGIQFGLTFYAGVFTPSTTAWETAIYVHPGIGNEYTIDANYNQNHQSIYACADLTLFDSTASTVHTFLLGGIGNDTLHPMTGYSDSAATMLQAFTNNGAHIQYDMNAKTSAAPEVLVDVFPSGQHKLYGAESTLIPAKNANIKYVSTGPSYNADVSEIIDLGRSTFTNDQLEVGYIYGGIEAYQLNPGNKKGGKGYGPGYSAASDKIWKVTLTRTATP